MFLIKFIISLGILAVVQLIFAESALAWGPGVHIVIALNLLDDVSLILPSVTRIITSSPIEYLYGCLAADFFIGKSKMKKASHSHNWDGGFKLLYEANDDPETAYAYGFLSHLAADVAAHNFFVPNLISAYKTGRKRNHLYWEIKADYLVGPGYTKIAKDVLSMDHQGCDDLLNVIAGKRRNGLGAKKLLFTKSVELSDYVFTTHHMIFSGRVVGRQVFNEYIGFMVALSCRLVKDFLRRPKTSPCLSHDPIGIRNLDLARREKSFTRLFNTRRQTQSFPVDQDLLEL